MGAIPAPLCCLLALAGARSQARRAERVRLWGRRRRLGKRRFGHLDTDYQPTNPYVGDLPSKPDADYQPLNPYDLTEPDTDYQPMSPDMDYQPMSPDMDHQPAELDPVLRPYEPHDDSAYEDGSETPDPEEMRRIEINRVERVKRSMYLSQCPQESAKKPEIALFGRSNVGKSSLLNFICNRKLLATVGRRPGHTKVVHHYLVDNSWYLVDLPGVGFIEGFRSRIKNSRRIVSAYVRHRRTLVEILYLVDATVKVQEVDLHAIKWLMDAGVYLSVVFTKTDKRIRDADIEHRGIVEVFVEELMAMDESPWRLGARPLPKFFLTSSKEKVGREPLLKHIYDIRKRAKPRVIAAKDERERAKKARKRIEDGELLKDVKKETRLPAAMLRVAPPGIR